MRETALPFLACPRCGGDLRLAVGAPEADGHVLSGTLACAACAAAYPIAGGVPRLVPERVHAGSARTAGRFGRQWKIFTGRTAMQEDWLRRWLEPVGPADFAGKVILEGGCGMGRHTVIAAGWGARAVVALDLGESVDVAFAHGRALANVHVVQGDLLAPPVKRAFDLAFSVGVLHHLPDPRAGFNSLRSRVVAGGRVAIWVYGYESNEWIVKLVSPLRERVTSRLPHSVLYWLTLPPSVALAAAARVYRTPLGDRLPYRAYLRRLGEITVREIHNVVFDQLTPPIAYYLPEAEVRSWFAAPGLMEAEISRLNENSWRGTARVTA